MKSILKFAAYPFRSLVLRINYWLGNYNPVIWLIADARSGTTWVADVLNYNRQLRELFEPFHPVFIKQFSFLGVYEYVAPSNERPELLKMAGKVLTGNIYHPRIDRNSKNLTYKGLLVKDILVNLYANYVYHHFDYVKILFLIRNPFAVALSKYGKRKWDWETDPEEFLKQELLVQDYLEPFKNLIIQESKEGDYITKQVLIWCILNYVPLQQFSPEEITFAFYEDIVMNPANEVGRILREFNLLKKGEVPDIPQTLINQPSVVSEKKDESYKDSLNAWRRKISDKQYARGMEILETFGFGGLYDDNSVPDRKVIVRLMNA